MPEGYLLLTLHHLLALLLYPYVDSFNLTHPERSEKYLRNIHVDTDEISACVITCLLYIYVHSSDLTEPEIIREVSQKYPRNIHVDTDEIPVYSFTCCYNSTISREDPAAKKRQKNSAESSRSFVPDAALRNYSIVWTATPVHRVYPCPVQTPKLLSKYFRDIGRGFHTVSKGGYEGTRLWGIPQTPVSRFRGGVGLDSSRICLHVVDRVFSAATSNYEQLSLIPNPYGTP